MTAGGDDPGSTASKLGHELQSRPPLAAVLRLVRDRFAQIGGTGGLVGWLRTATGVISAAVTLIASILTVVFLLWPALRPEERPSVFGATLSDPRLEHGVSVADVYARRGERPPADYSRERLATMGALVSFVVVVEGFQGKPCRLTWSLFDADTKTRVADEAFLDQPGWPDGKFLPVAAHDQASGEVWIRRPDRPGSYLVRLELFDPNGMRLTSLDSEPFTVARSMVPAGPVPGGLPTPSAPSSSAPAPGGLR
ncbi:MAG: hypothetical protein QOJ59_2046 [Thermomicrobiales bacterium]|nr:hypothetical protein [Thermomicrobiales bacterium]